MAKVWFITGSTRGLGRHLKEAVLAKGDQVAAEAFTMEQITSQIDTNLYGPIYVTRAVLPQLRQQRSGHILQISSLGGRIGAPGLSIYQAAKFGLVGFSEAVSKEIAPLGIKLTIVEPGGFRTDWAGDSMSFARMRRGIFSIRS